MRPRTAPLFAPLAPTLASPTRRSSRPCGPSSSPTPSTKTRAPVEVGHDLPEGVIERARAAFGG